METMRTRPTEPLPLPRHEENTRLTPRAPMRIRRRSPKTGTKTRPLPPRRRPRRRRPRGSPPASGSGGRAARPPDPGRRAPARRRRTEEQLLPRPPPLPPRRRPPGLRPASANAESTAFWRENRRRVPETERRSRDRSSSAAGNRAGKMVGPKSLPLGCACTPTRPTCPTDCARSPSPTGGGTAPASAATRPPAARPGNPALDSAIWWSPPRLSSAREASGECLTSPCWRCLP
mmetsp:Transcript_7303/g.13310  ORF Transcript_7303/g.13310 Transcript_7303/m.13310 type:complete len:233 (-) Transcript_7303:656-1354(-)